jgi:hypothetical protein
MAAVFRLPEVGNPTKAVWVVTSDSKQDAQAAVDRIQAEREPGMRITCYGPYLHRGRFRADVWGDAA